MIYSTIFAESATVHPVAEMPVEIQDFAQEALGTENRSDGFVIRLKSSGAIYGYATTLEEAVAFQASLVELIRVCEATPATPS